MRDVTFMDSRGVGALLSAYRRLKLHQRPLLVAEPQPIVARVLGITHFERLIPVVDSVTEAVDNCDGVPIALPRAPVGPQPVSDS